MRQPPGVMPTRICPSTSHRGTDAAACGRFWRSASSVSSSPSSAATEATQQTETRGRLLGADPARRRLYRLHGLQGQWRLPASATVMQPASPRFRSPSPHALCLSPSWAASSAGRAPPLHGLRILRSLPQDARDEATQGLALCNHDCNPHGRSRPRRYGRFRRCAQSPPASAKTLCVQVSVAAPPRAVVGVARGLGQSPQACPGGRAASEGATDWRTPSRVFAQSVHARQPVSVLGSWGQLS